MGTGTTSTTAAMTAGARTRAVASLDDRYTATEGDVILSGIQALVRTMLDQRRLDARRGLDTGLFISGYQGSPLGGVDREVLRLSGLLEPAGVVFRQGLNEELAATAVAGTQLIGELERRTVEGVTGIWFGKNPGLDRAADPIRHGNISGTAPLGGAVAWIGDDPSSKSSTVPSSCEPMCRSLLIPVLAPGSVAEILTFGLHAVAMSRHAGLWTGLKLVADVADSSAVVSLDGLLDQIPDLQRTREFHPPTMLPPTNLDAEADLMTQRLARACEYAEAAGLNRITVDPDHPRTAIVAAGLGYQSLLRALADLGVDEAALHTHGIRLVQLGMPWPLEPVHTRRLLAGVERVLVIEDKTAFVEGLIKEALYGLPDAPVVIGKRSADGAPLLSHRGELLSDDIVTALVRAVPGLASPAFAVPSPRRRTRHLELLPSRTPAFCSGCPHSISTRAEGDQLVGVGIGCHAMVALEPPLSGGGKRGQLVGITQMGGEGTQWLGLEPFTGDRHFFQNVGDGTFYHSASLAIRAAVAAGSTITYKLLFNDTVAMTGGQHPAGQMDIPTLTRWLTLEGVRRIVITTAHPETWRRTRFGATVRVEHRDRIPEIQRELEQEEGVTVLLHVDRCATEERRLRKRGKAIAPKERIWINERVCEGCGDCGDKSTCLSVLPVETEFGRKTMIHQSSCNQDASCLNGDCPSFVKVVPSGRPRTRAVPEAELPEPRRRVGEELLVRMPGIGGTGVVTASALLQMAAFLDGGYAAGVEQIGLAQKGGPVISDLRFSGSPVGGQIRAGRGTVDVLLAFDPLGAATDPMLDSLRAGALAVVNTGQTATSAMVQDTSVAMPAPDHLRARIDAATSSEESVYLDADALAERHFADHLPSNLILIGAAWQHGVLPVSASSLEEAIRLNGAAVETNLAAFRLGRIAVARPELLEDRPDVDPRPRLDRLADEVAAWQDRATAAQFVADVRTVTGRLESAGLPEADRVVAAYAEGLFKLTAYKDEFEVARLHLDGVEQARREAQFGERARVRILLHPPVLRALGMRRKIGLGSWFLPVLHLLYALRFLRGRRLNPFGWGRVRRTERLLPGEYRATMDAALAHLSPETLPLLLELAEAPDLVRGYEQVKLRNVERYRARVTELLTQLEAGPAPSTGHADPTPERNLA